MMMIMLYCMIQKARVRTIELYMVVTLKVVVFVRFCAFFVCEKCPFLVNRCFFGISSSDF